MSPAQFERLVEALIPWTAGRSSVTLTEAPANAADFLRLLEQAVVIGNAQGAPLAEIHAPLVAFPDFPSAFWHVPIEDSSRDGVVRLVFARQALSAAA